MDAELWFVNQRVWVIFATHLAGLKEEAGWVELAVETIAATEEFYTLRVTGLDDNGMMYCVDGFPNFSEPEDELRRRIAGLIGYIFTQKNSMRQTAEGRGNSAQVMHGDERG